MMLALDSLENTVSISRVSNKFYILYYNNLSDRCGNPCSLYINKIVQSTIFVRAIVLVFFFYYCIEQ